MRVKANSQNRACCRETTQTTADAGAGAWAWASNNGSDYFGQSYTPNGKETAVIMGGDYETLTPGPRTADAHIETAEHNSKIGVRFCCDSTL